MQQGLVSIITPCYNGEKYISETIESVIAQTYAKWELIIIDDGSTDNSVEIINNYRKKDIRIHLLKQRNSGSAAARNNGIRYAHGQYIALLDADDIWFSNFLEKQIQFMKEKKTVCVYSSYICIDNKSNHILSPIYSKQLITTKDMLLMNQIGCLSGLYDCLKYGKIFLHEEMKSMRDDYAYWMDIVKLEDIAYGNPEILAAYRVMPNSTTGKKYKLIRKQYNFYRQYLGLGIFRSLCHVCCWGIAGIKKFYVKNN